MFIKLKHTSQCFQQLQQLNSVTLLPHDSFLARQHPGHTPEKYVFHYLKRQVITAHLLLSGPIRKICTHKMCLIPEGHLFLSV